MSRKAKYKAVKDAMMPGFWFVESPRDIICQRCTMTAARKIARALNAMEDKPKAKPFAFDWSGIPTRYKFAAMDCDHAWYAFDIKPRSGTYAWSPDVPSFYLPDVEKPYPGDWRDSLQQRP